MRRIIFIDANQYLRFYDSNSREFKKLLKAIEEIHKNIFCTNQIKDEIDRNKLRVFTLSFNGYIGQFGIKRVFLPEHLEANAEEKIKQWNQVTKTLEEKISEQKKTLKNIAIEFAEKITTNKDEVSQTLAKVFVNSRECTEEQLIAARKRKEVGNPPGKINDPLGDQLSWGQLLSEANTIDELWIISNDTDFIIEFEGKYFLNPFLVSELKKKNGGVKIYCFRTLSEGLKSFSASNKIETLPAVDELEKIAEEEKQLNKIQELMSAISGTAASASTSVATGYSGYRRYTDYTGSGYSGPTGPTGPSGPNEIIQKAVEILRESLKGKDSD